MRNLYLVPCEGMPKKIRNSRKLERMLRPTNQSFCGRKLYSNNLGENFVVTLLHETTKLNSRPQYTIKVSEINGGLQNPRYKARITLFKTSLCIGSFVQLQWGEPTNNSPYTEHFPTRLVVNACIKLAEQNPSIKEVLAEARERTVASRLFELGFREYDPKVLPSWMALKLP